jgi:hypothetical protein
VFLSRGIKMGLIINSTKMGKPYINGIKYNAYISGQKIWNDVPPIHTDGFYFTVQDNGSFELPPRGINGTSTNYQNYNWIINWGDGNIETASGYGSNTAVINHTYSDGKSIHQIIIKTKGTETQGWLNAFGCGSVAQDAAKIISINSKITGLMRTMGKYAFYQMFYRCSGLTSIPSGLLPATILEDSCYYQMFNYCTGLTSIPSGLLPATNLKANCYNRFFNGCTGLTSIPKDFLPATTLVDSCYERMFYTCTGLTDIGNIDADWFSARPLAQSRMFNSCIKIITPITYAQIPANWKTS